MNHEALNQPRPLVDYNLFEWGVLAPQAVHVAEALERVPAEIHLAGAPRIEGHAFGTLRRGLDLDSILRAAWV